MIKNFSMERTSRNSWILSKWRNSKKVVEKSKVACENSNYDVLDHFADVGKMVKLGLGAERSIDDIMLSRYACYLIVQNADSRKK
ncbi:hypothetical protein [Clostridioides difficile]|nr:hypothetical protein [Clostridioides difficile]